MENTVEALNNNLMASGFNSMVWISSFELPTVQTLLRATTPTTWMVDLDIEEQFLNFCLHPETTKYVGVDLSPFFEEELKQNNSSFVGKIYKICNGYQNISI